MKQYVAFLFCRYVIKFMQSWKMFNNMYSFRKNYVLGFEIKIIGFH